MILFEKEWQEYKDSQALKKLQIATIFILAINICYHLYSYLMAQLSAGVLFDYVYVSSMYLSWKEILLFFNQSTLYLFFPLCIFANAGSLARTKLKNSHYFAVGVPREYMGFVKIFIRLIMPIVYFLILSFVVSLATNILFENTVYTVSNVNLQLSVAELYLQSLAQIPLALMCMTIALLAEQMGHDKTLSIFFFFGGLIGLLALLGLSNVLRSGMMEVYHYIIFQTSAVDLQQFILGQLLFLCLFITALTLSVARYARAKKI